MIFKFLKSIYIKKGEGLLSPFTFLLLFLVYLNTVSAQFSISNWLHPASDLIQFKGTKSYFQIINYSNANIISNNNSMKITETTNSMKYVKYFKKNVFKIRYDQHQSSAGFIKPKYSFNVENNYGEVLVGYGYNISNFFIEVDLKKKSSIGEISPFVLLTSQFHPLFTLSYGKSRDIAPINLEINFLDFNYKPDNIYTINNSVNYGLTFKDEKFRIDYILIKDYWEINKELNSGNWIDLDYGKNNKFYFRGKFYLKNKSEIGLTYKENNQDIALQFYHDPEILFLKINRFNNINKVKAITFKASLLKHLLTLQLMQQETNLLLSSRIWPSRLGESLSSLIGIIVNNKNTGYLNQKMVSIKIESPIWKNVISIINFEWLRDKYDFNLDTDELLFGFPVYSTEDYLNIIGKDAVNANFGLNFKNEGWLISVKLSQHIPIKINYIKKPTTEVVSEPSGEVAEFTNLTTIIRDIESELSGGNYYGGGLYHLSFTKFLD